MPVETYLSADASVLNVVLSGEFDIERSMQIQETIESCPDSVRRIRMDLQHVSRIDSTIFSTLLLLYFDKDRQAQIELINCDKSLARRLSLAGLDRLITIKLSYHTPEAVVADSNDSQTSTDHQ